MKWWQTKSSESRNFFSFKGRARRGLFWGIVAAAILFAIALSFVGPASDYFFERSSPIARNELSWAFQAPVYLAKVLLICVAVSGCAVLIRRFHDINMPTWLAVVSFAIMVVCGVLSMKCAYRARLASPDRLLIQKFRGESGGDLTEEGRALLSALVKESMTVSPEEEERYKTAAAGFGIACFVALLFNSLVGVVPGTSGPNRYGPPPAR